MEHPFVKSCPVCHGTTFSPWMQVKDYRATGELFSLVKCNQCSLIITQNQPGEKEIGRYYETDDYISHGSHTASLMDKVYHTVRKMMATSKEAWVRKWSRGIRIIDIGAGTGFFVAHMKNHGWQIEGMEPSEAARSVALKEHKVALKSIPALFQTPGNSADLITMWHVLEHVHDPAAYLKQIALILQPAGVLMLALPNYQSYDAKYYKEYWGAWDVPRHLWHFSPKAVETLVHHFGFRIARRYTLPFDSFYVSLISEKYKGGGFLRNVRGILIGKLSMFNAWTGRRKASSVVYVCVKIT